MTKPYRPIMGQQQSGKHVITIYLTTDVVLELNARAKERGIAVSRMASQIVTEFMKQVPVIPDKVEEAINNG